MKKTNVFLEILKVFLSILGGCFLWLTIFAFCTPDEIDTVLEPFPGASAVLGILTTLISYLCLNYNALSKACQNSKAARNDVRIFEERLAILLEKATRVAVRYMQHQRDNTGTALLSSSLQFQTLLQDFPTLRENEHIHLLLHQLQTCEAALSNQKRTYNKIVNRYHVLLHRFPTNILGKLFGFKDAVYYHDIDNWDIVSDEKLGIQ